MRLFFLVILFIPVMVQAVDLRISEAWIAKAPPGAQVFAAYLDIENKGDKPVTISGAFTQDFSRVEIHRMSMDKGMMKMEKQSTVSIAPGETVHFKPGGLHLMLFDPQENINAKSLVYFCLLENGDCRYRFRASVLAR